jgi:hypothetical protein
MTLCCKGDKAMLLDPVYSEVNIVEATNGGMNGGTQRPNGEAL